MATPIACSLLVLLAGVAGAQQLPSPSPAGSSFAPWPTSSDAPAPQGLAAAQQPPDTRQQPPAPPIGGVRPVEQFLDLEQPAPYTIQLEVPPISRVAISVESDAQLKERIRQENRERKTPERIVFPADPVISTEAYAGRKWYPMRLEVAPYYVCHGRLRFQQINFERYGWDLGVFSPLISGGMFLWDFVTLPYHLAMEPCRCFEYNTGWCLPGDPVPLLLYPLQISPTGFVAEVGTILTLVAVFP
jgi:hypothetical protein